ncbi:hypothetical protein Lepto7376_3632 [[Leptolyngbya] sp. PCC 7376]|uniref:DUF3131 domain-containing protein n=1 Tax=[Leptolyngbya] sp. PCC 7376 TaxID=111781 RepID=UPI00029F3A98|nr:DUF3131 domain-containing protein [[Leptolyngbya] sp. PCC 7376]AFY39812.1 hypothetical protein Lepto7376_3632 [[Leptolyngbya] sp. PCC 7376]
MSLLSISRRWKKFCSWIAVGLFLSCWLSFIQVSPAPAQTPATMCGAIAQPLTPEEQNYAQSAWNYFVDNVQPETGLSNSAGGYPSGTLWDLGNYLTAMNAALWMGLIDHGEFDSRLNQFLTSLSELRLFEDTLPNKVYNSATKEIVDYGNNPIERGIGWSALDIGRILAAFHIIRTCHPQYSDWMAGIVASWNISASLENDMLYGATVLPDGSTLKVQEGRLGYEEYAARGYALWGFNAPAAIAYDPFKFVDIYGLQIPVDQRDYFETNANNYVVSESYILDAIEFGLQGDQAEYARRVFEAQKRRYEDTGLLTAVSEDNINQPPYFLYSTVYSNGEPWAVITESNELHPELRTLSSKSAFGWHYVYPDDPYAQQIFDHVKDTTNSGRGYYAGIYESGLYDPQPPLNDILTGNTNGLILEILYYKARGYQPMLGENSAPQSTAIATPTPAVSQSIDLPPPPTTQANNSPEAIDSPPLVASTQQVSASNDSGIEVAAIDPVDAAKSSSCPLPKKKISVTDARYAAIAWQYFDANYEQTGLVPDRSDLDGSTVWGIGDYLAALHAARTLNVISPKTFDERVRHLLGALQEMELFAGELPYRAYNTLTLEPIDYGGNSDRENNGWSGLDIGRLLASLHVLKTCHPEYEEAIDQLVLDWSYLRVVRDGKISNATLAKNSRGRHQIQVQPAQILGYEEYAARGFQLWGFDAQRSSISGEYVTKKISDEKIPVERSQLEQRQQDEQLNTISTPFILYGLEFGFDPQSRNLIESIYRAEAKRYEQTGIFSASGTTLIQNEPYIVHSTLVADGEPWAAVDDDGNLVEQGRVVSTAIAFAYQTLFAGDDYGQELWQATLDLYNPILGYYEGFYENTGQRTFGLTSSTNSLILQALLHKNIGRQPIIQPHETLSSPWWKAIRDGDRDGLGLPTQRTPAIELKRSAENQYWDLKANETQANNSFTNTVAVVNQPQDKQDTLMVSEMPSNLSKAIALLPHIATTKPSAAAQKKTLNQIALPLTSIEQIPDAQDQIAAKQAWQYIANNWQGNTGLVNSVDNYDWTTWWDQGSAIFGLHAAYQLGLIGQQDFQIKLITLLNTLETLPLPKTNLPNKAYSTTTAQMRTLSNKSDPGGRSGWSVLDLSRYLLALQTLKTHYPEFGDRLDKIIARYDLSQLEKDGWLQGSGWGKNGLQYWQEGRLGYEQYAAESLQKSGITATNALHHSPTKTVRVENIALEVDQRNRKSSGASNYLVNDPYTLWGMEIGWTDQAQTQIRALLQAQKNRAERTGFLTAINEDSLDRKPYFLYYSAYADGEPWSIKTVSGKSHPELRFLSTKAAFALASLFPEDDYCQQLLRTAQTLGDHQKGFFAGKYENEKLGINHSLNINTNAIILESLLYKLKGSPISNPN